MSEQETRMRELVRRLNETSYAYYVLDDPVISDMQWDRLYDELRRLEAETGVVLEDSALGPRVLGVLVDSPAQRCGVHPGDVLTELDDQQLHSSAQLEQQLASGTASCLTVERGGKQMRLTLHR